MKSVRVHENFTESRLFKKFFTTQASRLFSIFDFREKIEFREENSRGFVYIPSESALIAAHSV